MAKFPAWQGAKTCTGSVTLGAKSLLAWFVANAELGHSGGIYNCRTVVGGESTSLHGEGRALDWMLPVTAAGKAIGHAIVQLLLLFVDVLGIQCIIYDRTIWSAVNPNGRPYKGKHPHYDHIHIEFSWAGANNLTLATIVHYLGGRSSPDQVAPEVKPTEPKKPSAPKKKWEEVLMANLPVVSTKANSGTIHAKRVQSLLAANGHPPAYSFSASGRPDGVFGKQSDAAVRRFQKAKSLKVDGVVGENTWKALLG